MIRRTLLRAIAIQSILVFVLFFVIQPEAIGWGRSGGGGGYSREGTASRGSFPLAERLRKEAQASKVEAVTRRTVRAAPPRIRLSANRARKVKPIRASKVPIAVKEVVRLMGKTRSKVIRLMSRRHSRVIRLMSRTRSKVIRLMSRTRSRVAKVMGRTRNRAVKIMQLTTDRLDPMVHGPAAVRLEVGAVTTLEGLLPAQRGWRWVQRSRAFLRIQRPL